MGKNKGPFTLVPDERDSGGVEELHQLILCILRLDEGDSGGVEELRQQLLQKESALTETRKQILIIIRHEFFI